MPWRRVPLEPPEAGEAPAKKAKPSTSSASTEMSDWAKRYLESCAPIPGGAAPAPDAGVESLPEVPLDDDILERIFSDFVDPDRIARMEGPRVAEHFVVKMRGQDSNVEKKGDRYDVARAQPQGNDVMAWTGAHFAFKTKSIDIKLAGGDEPARKLCQEWCKKMELMYELHREHSSWASAGGMAAVQAYTDSDEWIAWVDSLPPNSYCRTKAGEIRKLSPTAV